MIALGLADTSVFIAAEQGRTLDRAAFPDAIGASAITIGELRAGVLMARDHRTRARRLATLTRVLDLEPIPVDAAVTEAWAELRVALREAGLRMPANDSWIAATALAHDLPLVTQDRDQVEVAGLRVIHV